MQKPSLTCMLRSRRRCQKNNYQYSCAFLQAASSGVHDIVKHLVEIKVDADVKNSDGKGVLQLCKDSGGPRQTSYLWLVDNAKDKNDKPLVATSLPPSRGGKYRQRGSHSQAIRHVNTLVPTGSAPTVKGHAKGKKAAGCYRCGHSDHHERDCPQPYPDGKVGIRGKGKGKVPEEVDSWLCPSCNALDHRDCPCPSRSFIGKGKCSPQ